MNQFESIEFARVRVRAASGATADDILAEVAALNRRGFTAEVSLAAPCADLVHRALTRLGARVRVETLDGWVSLAARDVDVYVVGPTRSAAATWRLLGRMQEQVSVPALNA